MTYEESPPDGLRSEEEVTRLDAVDRLDALFRTLMDLCGESVLELDHRGVIVGANHCARNLLGHSGSLMEGRTILEATLSEDLHLLFRKARERSMYVHGRASCGPVGAQFRVEIAPITDEEDGVGGYLLVAHDETERTRVDTIRKDFVANVSHELRTPLASIRAMAETLQDGALNDPKVADRFLGTIVTETDRLTRIADDLLVLSEAENGKVRRVRLDVGALAGDVVTRIRHQAIKRELRIESSIETGLMILGSAGQIEQVLVNLVENAVKYTQAGGKVTVVATREGDVARITVTDTGIGILSKDLPRIFERFYRVDKARSRQSGGTGLGLSIVKHIVEAHGGRVGVESEYHHGSSFSVTLPLDRTYVAKARQEEMENGEH